MNAALLFFGLLWAIMGGGKRGGSPAAPSSAPQLPATGTTASTPPWPSVRPTGLPPFPGAGWEYDEPPPRAVQQRAGALRAQLWARGKGAHQTEQTGGRWITYRAEITRGGKQGVVAYRERRSAAPSPPRGTTARRAPAPPAVGPIVIPVANATGPNVYLMRPGTTYRVQAEADLGLISIDPNGIKQGLELGGATNVSIVQTASATIFRYDMNPRHNQPIVLGEWIEVPVPPTGNTIRFRFIEVAPISARTSPVTMPTLRQGSRGADVVTLQTRLGVQADGIFGAGTRAAVVAYQRQHGLTPDGIVGPQTWITLLGKAA